MRISKIAISLIFSGALVIPALAQAATQADLDAAADEAISKVPVRSDGAFDMSKIHLTKKEYMDQLSKSFDRMDANGDGVVDGTEMVSGQQAAGTFSSDEEEEAYKAAHARQPAKTVAPAGGVAPINASQLNK